MIHKIDRSDSDFNTIQWQDDPISIARQSRSHVQVNRSQLRFSRSVWSLAIDVTSGHEALEVGAGNRLVCVGGQHILALTCAQHSASGSLHNYHLHYIHPDGHILWSLPWQTVQRYTLVDDKLLILRYVSPPVIWIPDVPLEAHLLDPETGESQWCSSIAIPQELQVHYQSWQVTNLRTYLVWKEDALIATVRPFFQPNYKKAHMLNNRGSFKHKLTFDELMQT